MVGQMEVKVQLHCSQGELRPAWEWHSLQSDRYTLVGALQSYSWAKLSNQGEKYQIKVWEMGMAFITMGQIHSGSSTAVLFLLGVLDQGSLLFPKIEFFIKAYMRGWSFF